MLKYAFGDSWPQTPKDIAEPSHGRVFGEKFRSVHVVKLAHRCVIEQKKYGSLTKSNQPGKNTVIHIKEW